jgi:hypothetical protein
VAAVNDSPVNTVPGFQRADVNTPIYITGISVDDVDAGLNDVEVTLSVNNGTLRVNGSVAGGLAITDNNSSSVTLTGTLNQINNTLGDATGLQYQADPDFSGYDELAVTSNDQGYYGSEDPKVFKSDTDQVVIAVGDVPDPVPDGTDGGFVGFHWKDYYDMGDNGSGGDQLGLGGSLEATYSLLDFLSSQGILPESLTAGAGTENEASGQAYFGILLNEAIFGEDQQSRNEAWGGLFQLLEEEEIGEDGALALGLAEFLHRLQDWRAGQDLDDVVLVFNAGEIKLVEWFDSLMAPEGDWLSGKQTSAPDLEEPVQQLRYSTNMVFDMDELTVADAFDIEAPHYDASSTGGVSSKVYDMDSFWPEEPMLTYPSKSQYTRT